MPIRNPFAKRTEVHTGLQPSDDEFGIHTQNASRPKFEKVDTMGSKASSMSISSRKSEEPPEYKMSVVNDSGVYLPPSPPEKKGIWPRRSHPSGNSTSTRNSEDIEHFSISRESFDSYRRSFDISARSPVISTEKGRQSLDSARMPRLPRSAIHDRHFETPLPTAEENFEDVGLNDEQKQQPKKKAFWKFGDGTSDPHATSTTSRFHIPGRKRGQSGVGEELGNMQRPGTAGSSDVKDKELKDSK